MLWLRMGALEHVGPIIPFELWECKLLSVSVMAERMGGAHGIHCQLFGETGESEGLESEDD